MFKVEQGDWEMKLKTLKDLEIKRPEGSMLQFGTGFCKTEELKAEAIKWVKEIKNGYSTFGIHGADECFIKFFNITEEENKK